MLLGCLDIVVVPGFLLCGFVSRHLLAGITQTDLVGFLEVLADCLETMCRLAWFQINLESMVLVGPVGSTTRSSCSPSPEHRSVHGFYLSLMSLRTLGFEVSHLMTVVTGPVILTSSLSHFCDSDVFLSQVTFPVGQVCFGLHVPELEVIRSHEEQHLVQVVSGSFNLGQVHGISIFGVTHPGPSFPLRVSLL